MSALPAFAITNMQSADYRIAQQQIPAPIDCADLHHLARADRDGYRATLAALTAPQLLRQATYYAAYASERTGLDVTTADALESFLRSIARASCAQTAAAIDGECGF
jgi:hypothetical protein